MKQDPYKLLVQILLTLAIVMVPVTVSAQSARPLNLGTLLKSKPKSQPPKRAITVAPKFSPFRNQSQPAVSANTNSVDQNRLINAMKAATTGNPLSAATSQNSIVSTTTPRNLIQNIQPPEPVVDIQQGIASVVLTARLTPGGDTISRGLVWRVFNSKRDENNRLPLVQTLKGGTGNIDLPTGIYLVHASYGHAGLTKKITLTEPGIVDEDFVLAAGGLRLNAIIFGDLPLNEKKLKFDIFSQQKTGNYSRNEIVSNIDGGTIIRLGADTYHIVSRYGVSNAVVRADVIVTAGQLTDATLIHRAAEMTFKLVSEAGGEALADTRWSILTPGGDLVREVIGAFPAVILSEGDYTAIAINGGDTFNRDFSVEPGLDRDVEVYAQRQ